MTHLTLHLASSSGFLKYFSADWMESFLNRISPWQYLVLFLVIFAESGILIGMFFPGDSLLFTAGFLAYKGDLNMWLLIPLFFVAAFSGDQAGYFIGRGAGDKFFKNENAKILKPSHVTKTHEFFEKHGPKTILLARFVPIVRTLAPIMAGTGKMSYKTFVTYNAIGAAVWGVGVTCLGYFLGKTIGADKIDKYLIPIIFLIVFVSFIPPFIEWRKSKKESSAKETDEVLS